MPSDVEALKNAEESKWVPLREAQLITLASPNTGMAVTVDVGDPLDIHPARKQPVGARLVVTFQHTGGGLKADDGALTGFENTGNRVLVWSTHVPDPVAVRYAWADYPEVSLYNVEGLPASPFRVEVRWAACTEARNFIYPQRVIRYDHEKCSVTEDQQGAKSFYVWVKKSSVLSVRISSFEQHARMRPRRKPRHATPSN